MIEAIKKWAAVKWFWLVRNTVAAARMGWDAGGGIQSKVAVPDIGKFRG